MINEAVRGSGPLFVYPQQPEGGESEADKDLPR